jgi:hypothetical protein
MRKNTANKDTNPLLIYLKVKNRREFLKFISLSQHFIYDKTHKLPVQTEEYKWSKGEFEELEAGQHTHTHTHTVVVADDPVASEGYTWIRGEI